MTTGLKDLSIGERNRGYVAGESYGTAIGLGVSGEE